jgi:hypothetical protein
MHGKLQVVFFPNYNVKNGQLIFPAADLSEQISLAGKEASGTGNMKFQMNGALTIGTLDGANVEILEQVGEENFFLFGMNTPEVKELRNCGYRPRDYYEANPQLREVIDLISSGFFTRGDRDVFRPWSSTCSTTTSTCCWPTSSRTSTVRKSFRGLSRLRALVADVDSQRRALGLLLVRSCDSGVLHDIWRVRAGAYRTQRSLRKRTCSSSARRREPTDAKRGAGECRFSPCWREATVTIRRP